MFSHTPHAIEQRHKRRAAIVAGVAIGAAATSPFGNVRGCIVGVAAAIWLAIR